MNNEGKFLEIYLENIYSKGFLFSVDLFDVVSFSGELQACCKFGESVKMTLNVQSSSFVF